MHFSMCYVENCLTCSGSQHVAKIEITIVIILTTLFLLAILLELTPPGWVCTQKYRGGYERLPEKRVWRCRVENDDEY